MVRTRKRSRPITTSFRVPYENPANGCSLTSSGDAREFVNQLLFLAPTDLQLALIEQTIVVCGTARADH